MIGLERISVGEPLENIGQLVRLNLAETQDAIPPLTFPVRWGAIYGDLGEPALDDQ